MDVVDAEGLDDDAVGEEKTERKRTNGTFNNDSKERDGCETLKMTRTLFHLEPTWYAHTGNERMMRRGVRTRRSERVCASSNLFYADPLRRVQ